eukprot:2784868-Rhodomonas_salina.1
MEHEDFGDRDKAREDCMRSFEVKRNEVGRRQPGLPPQSARQPGRDQGPRPRAGRRRDVSDARRQCARLCRSVHSGTRVLRARAGRAGRPLRPGKEAPARGLESHQPGHRGAAASRVGTPRLSTASAKLYAVYAETAAGNLEIHSSSAGHAAAMEHLQVEGQEAERERLAA